MKLPISILLIATYLVPGKARYPRSRYYYSNVSTEPITYQYQSQSQVISGREANDNNAVNIDSSRNKPHPSLSCLLFNDDGCQLSCYLLCNIHGCQSEAFCRNRYYCECNEMYFVNNNVLTANQFRDLTFQDLWNYKFAPSRLSSAVQKRILQDNEMYQFILPLLQNPHKNGDDVKNALLQRYPELQTAQYLQTIEHGVKSTLYSDDNGLTIEQYIQDMIHDMRNEIYNRISHTRYMRRIINLIKNIADQDDLQYILKQLFLTGNQRLYERVRRYLIKKGYYFESEFPDGGSRKRRKCRRKKKQRKKGCKCKNAEHKIFGYTNNYPYNDDYDAWVDKEEEDAKLMLIIELLNTSKTDGQFPNTPQIQQISPSQQATDAPAEVEYINTPPQQSHNIVIEKTGQQVPQQQVLSSSTLQPQQTIYVDKTAQQPSQELHMNDAFVEGEYKTPPQQSHIIVTEKTDQQVPQQQVLSSSTLQPQQTIYVDKTAQQPSQELYMNDAVAEIEYKISPQQSHIIVIEEAGQQASPPPQQQQQQQIYVHKMVQQPSQEAQVSHTNSVLQQPTTLSPPPPPLQHIPYTSKIIQQQQQLPQLQPEISQIETIMSSPSSQQLPIHNQQQQMINMNKIMQEQLLSPSQPPLLPQPSPHQQQITYVQKMMHQPPSPLQITFEEKIQPPRPPPSTQHQQISYVEMMEHLPPQQQQVSYTKLMKPTNSLPSQKNEVIEISHVPSFEQTKQNIMIQNSQIPTITHMQQVIETSESPITKETEINQHLPPPPTILKNEKAQSLDTTSPVVNAEDDSSDEVQLEKLFLKNSPLTSDQQEAIMEKSLKPEVFKSSPSITDIPPEFFVQDSNIEVSPSPFIDDSEPVILETYDIPDSTSTTTSILMKNKPSPMISETVQSKMQPTEILLNSQTPTQTPSGYSISSTSIINNQNAPVDTKKQPESYAYYLFNGDGDLGEPKTEQVQSLQTIQNQSINQEEIITTIPPPQPQPQPVITKQTKGKKFYSFLMDENGNIIKSANYHYPGETEYSQVIHNSSPTNYVEESAIFEKLDRQNLLNAAKEKASDTVIIDDIDDIHNLPTPDENLLNNKEANIPNLVSSDTQNPKIVEKVTTSYTSGSNSAILHNREQSKHSSMPQDLTVGSTSYTYNSGATHMSSSPAESYQNNYLQIQTDDYDALDYDTSDTNDIPIGYESTAQQNHQWIDIEAENDNLDTSGDSVLTELDTDEEANNDIIYQTHKEDENNLNGQIAQVTSNLSSDSVTTQTQTSFSKSSTTKNELVEEIEIREEHDHDVSIDITCDDPLNPEDDLMNF